MLDCFYVLSVESQSTSISFEHGGCGNLGDQLSVQNSLKINVKFLDSLLDIDFYRLTIIFFLGFFLDITIFFNFPP